MDIHEIRKANLIALIGRRKKGACADKWEIAPAHLSQILSDKTAKNLGDEVARRIEDREGLKHGWLDQLQGAARFGSAIEAAEKETGLQPISGPDLSARNLKEVTARATDLLDLIDSPRSKTAIERIVEAASSGALTELDMVLLEQIAERFSGGKQALKPTGVNEKLARKVKDAPKNPH